MSARETLLTALAKAVRDLDDEKLVEIAAPWIAETFASAVGATAAPPQREEAPVQTRSAPRRGKAAKSPAKKRATAKPAAKPAAAKKSTPSPKQDETDARVFNVLVASDGALSKSQLVEKTKLPDQAVGHSLRRLKEAGRAFLAGSTRRARWAITQEAADEAVGG